VNKAVHRKPKRIVVVGERGHVTRELQRSLVALGYDVPVTVGTREQTIAVVSAFQADLIVVDLALGQMSELQVARQMRAHLTVRLLFVSDALDQDQLLHAARTRPNALLSRPYSLDELAYAVVHALGSRHPRAAGS
jgi:DNA-binding response OmpR family regulator